MLIRAVHAEMQKARHSLFWVWRIVLPLLAAGAFGFYYMLRPMTQELGASLFYEVLAAVFPVGIAWMSAMGVDWEEESQSQRLFGFPSRTVSWYGKLGVLYFMGCITTIVTVLLAQLLVVRDSVLVHAVSYMVMFAVTNLMYYPLHLFLVMRFGRAVSIFAGLVGSVAGLLLLTGIGDGCWYFIPCAVNVRMGGYISQLLYGHYDAAVRLMFQSEIKTAIPFLILWAVVLLVIPAIWFRRWEGRSVSE